MSTPTSEQHRLAAADRGPVPIALVTVSDSRTAETDTNGSWLRARIAESGNTLVGQRLIADEPELVVAALDELTSAGARIVLFNGGTGISSRDTTYDALATRFEKPIPGFGELFRMLSWQQVGSAAMLSRAAAGVYRGAVVISTPGSPAAVRLAWDELIAPELEHLAWELSR